MRNVELIRNDRRVEIESSIALFNCSKIEQCTQYIHTIGRQGTKNFSNSSKGGKMGDIVAGHMTS